jgi:hypothetical protein
VVDQNNEPVVGVSVYPGGARILVRRAARRVRGAGTSTDDQGAYRLERVQPGRAYTVMASGLGARFRRFRTRPWTRRCACRAVVPTYYPNARSIDGAEPVVLRPGERRDGVDIRLTRSPAFCLEGLLEGISRAGRRALQYRRDAAGQRKKR